MLISDIADCQQYWVKPIANTGTFVYNSKVNQGKFQGNNPGCVYFRKLFAMNSERMLLKEKEVCELLGFSKSTLWREVARGAFPKPYKFGKRMTRWSNWEVQEWVTQLCKSN